MTGTEKIKEKILEDARARAVSIKEQAEQEARSIMEQTTAEADNIKAGLLEKAQTDGAQLYKRMLAVAGLEGRKTVLGVKQEMIDSAFAEAMEKVINMPDHEYQKLLENMIAEAAGCLGGEVLLSEKDAARIDKQFVSNINQRLTGLGKAGLITLSKQSIRAAGGFILKSGDMEINSTFEILFNILRSELESETVKILFGS